MHPNTAFHWSDREALREFVRVTGFGSVFAATPDGPRTAQVPVIWADEGTLHFHLARGNALTRHLEGETALFVAMGPDGYVSPDWYGLDDNQVPTWNYVSVELEGTVRRLSRDALIAQMDALSAEHEGRLAPKPAWTRAKMDPALFERMADAVVGFALDIQGWRGTRKLGQNKSEGARLSAADGMEASGRRAIAHWMREGVA